MRNRFVNSVVHSTLINLKIPKPKVPTRWEKFAKEKGIHRTKNSKIEWSDEKKDWVPTWGYQGANQDEDWVTEIPENAGSHNSFIPFPTFL